ncbi:HD domain-containing protein [Shimwellia pseudoproteus]|uniref:HD domain-containing phosphohydrolase n=1 Tax=Shimwellia pseudoproteus TaxID=570012 RepID=UPI0018EE30AF|nr:HD domain-containing phosphohydrolase [Shimwellia pseudoproteus]MBJ3814165.1 HD domain-containing protein [Shimwellia pseudoproteus]
MDISFHSALKLVIDVISAVNPTVSNHMQRTACIAQELALRLNLSTKSQSTVFVAALLHDIGMIGDARQLDTLNDIDYYDDPHQQTGYQMLYGFKVFKPIRDIILHHHQHMDNDPEGKASLEQYIVAFADCVERMLPTDDKQLFACASDIIRQATEKYRGHFPDQILTAFRQLENQDYFWFRLELSGLRRVTDIISPVKVTHLDIDQFREICLLIARIVDKYSSFTVTHSIIVGAVARRLAKQYGMGLREQKLIEIAGYLHDLGKIYVPVTIIEKAAQLNEKEFSRMKGHSYKTGEILSEYPALSTVAQWAEHHHERLDGSGYPYHLTKAYLDIPSRILAIADIFTALTEDRPYRKGMSNEQALAIIRQEVDEGKLDADIYQCLAGNVALIDCGMETVRKNYLKKSLPRPAGGIQFSTSMFVPIPLPTK